MKVIWIFVESMERAGEKGRKGGRRRKGRERKEREGKERKKKRQKNRVLPVLFSKTRNHQHNGGSNVISLFFQIKVRFSQYTTLQRSWSYHFGLGCRACHLRAFSFNPFPDPTKPLPVFHSYLRNTNVCVTSGANLGKKGP